MTAIDDDERFFGFALQGITAGFAAASFPPPGKARFTAMISNGRKIRLNHQRLGRSPNGWRDRQEAVASRPMLRAAR
ncbi:hypothetical protein [Rhizobium indicum]|uniref:Uncharacterized protein n=1 Tax=Rhizobium indicum TaxID=2583231 RepID=A0ABX6PFR2_9HYPH|nr:hypothetical protein [Rhizobium indicum]QKK17945.1 hypothetical protein FFM53_016520 [Rhizobium indicum]